MPPRPLMIAAVALAAIAASFGLHRGSVVAAPAAPPASDAGGYRFDAGVSAINRQAFLNAAGRVRPEAARLLDRVDGLVTVVDRPTPDGVLGLTIPRPRGYTVQLSFGEVFQRLGQRGFDRVVQHELGHVVDFALVPGDLAARLDAGIPPGQPCTGAGRTGSCAPREERFAETFAKWASGDIGVELYAGYAVPPPPDLDAWGAPLGPLAAAAGR